MLRLVLVLSLLLPVALQAAPWQLSPETQVAVDVPWQGRKVEVRFPTMTGVVDFDADHPETARAAISVSARDVETGLPPVNALVRSAGYLDAASFPTITFRLDRLVQTSKSTADIFGSLTLRGVTQPISFQAKVFRYGPAEDDPDRFEAGFNLTGQIDRTAFGSTADLPEVGAVLGLRVRLVMTSK